MSYDPANKAGQELAKAGNALKSLTEICIGYLLTLVMGGVFTYAWTKMQKFLWIDFLIDPYWASTREVTLYVYLGLTAITIIAVILMLGTAYKSMMRAGNALKGE